MTSLDQIVEAALQLPSLDRARLADRLVESLDSSNFNEIDRLWAVEVRRRLDQVRNGEVQLIPGDEALRRVRESLGQ